MERAIDSDSRSRGFESLLAYIKLICIRLDLNQCCLNENRIMSPAPSTTWLRMLYVFWNWWESNPRPLKFIKRTFCLLREPYRKNCLDISRYHLNFYYEKIKVVCLVVKTSTITKINLIKQKLIFC